MATAMATSAGRPARRNRCAAENERLSDVLYSTTPLIQISKGRKGESSESLMALEGGHRSWNLQIEARRLGQERRGYETVTDRVVYPGVS